MAKAAQKELEALSTKEVQAKLKQMKAQRTMDANEWGNTHADANDATNKTRGNENIAVRDATSFRGEAYQKSQVDASRARLAYSEAKKDMEAAKKDAKKVADDKRDIMSLIKDEKFTTDVVAAASEGVKGGDGKQQHRLKPTTWKRILTNWKNCLRKQRRGMKNITSGAIPVINIFKKPQTMSFSGLFARCELS